MPRLFLVRKCGFRITRAPFYRSMVYVQGCRDVWSTLGYREFCILFEIRGPFLGVATDAFLRPFESICQESTAKLGNPKL